MEYGTNPTHILSPFSQLNFTSFFKMSSPCTYPLLRKRILLHIFLTKHNIFKWIRNLLPFFKYTQSYSYLIFCNRKNCTPLFSFNGPRKRLQKHMSPFINKTLIHHFSFAFASKIRHQNWEQKMLINRIVTTDLPHKDKTRAQLPPDKRAGQIRILNTLKELRKW